MQALRLPAVGCLELQESLFAPFPQNFLQLCVIGVAVFVARLAILLRHVSHGDRHPIALTGVKKTPCQDDSDAHLDRR